MQKRGQLSLEWLVSNIPQIIIMVILFGAFVLLILIFTSEEPDKERQDFNRIIAEVTEFTKTDYVGEESIRVPVDSKSPLNIITYPAGKGPDVCQGLSCICLVFRKGDKLKTECEVYQDIKNTCKADECGDLCFSKTRTLTLDRDSTSVTVTRTCHEIILSQ